MPYPRGFEDRLDAIEKRLDQLFASIQNRGGTTSASAGLIFPSQSTPATPPSGGHLHASGNDPYWRDASGGNRALIQPEFVRGGSVADPTFGSSALGTGVAVNGAMYNDLREDVFSSYNQIVNLLAELRGRSIDY